MKLYMEGISAVNNITKQGFNACDWTNIFIIYYIMDYRTALEKILKICFAKLHGRLKKNGILRKNSNPSNFFMEPVSFFISF